MAGATPSGDLPNYERLGVFYLGKQRDLSSGATLPNLVLYDSKDLTTHAVCVGMTGSGKTGLCLALLEEAAIDGVPVLAIDPKGDLGNLLLTFPQLSPTDFRPWIDEAAATRAGATPDDFAAQTAEKWKKGLADWQQPPERIARFRDSVDVNIYTPGGSAGLPISVLRGFDAPPPEWLDQREFYQERLQGAAQSLLALLSIDADPVRSREQILLTNILDHAWRAGRNLSLAKLVEEIQTPPFDRVGVLDLETFYPAKDRVGLSLQVNNLLASTSFADWLKGEPLDIQRLLYTSEGKPRISILSIAHLSDAERMFFVTLFLNEVLTWMRKQSGTSSLRAILYMDEIFGYFPPIGEPPSKRPMLTLLKQARAFGLGLMLCTQNPVDLDYKGLSNCGTWFLGRLQTERDKQRVLEGLEGANSTAGKPFDRGAMEQTLAGLGNRVFLLNNVHDDAPIIFQTRWALSYLAGPMSSAQIRKLMANRKSGTVTATASGVAAKGAAASSSAADSTSAIGATSSFPEGGHETAKPVVPAEIPQLYLSARPGVSGQLVYRPAVYAQAKLHYADSKLDIDAWQTRGWLLPLESGILDSPWEAAQTVVAADLDWDAQPGDNARFTAPAGSIPNVKQYKAWEKTLKSFLFQSQTLEVLQCKEPKLSGKSGETEAEFKTRLKHVLREQRDLAVERLRAKFATKLAQEQERKRRAEERLDREKSQAQQTMLQSVASVGASLVGAFLGNRLASKTNLSKAATSVNSMSRAMKERGDIDRANDSVEAIDARIAALDEQLKEDVAALEAQWDVDTISLQRVTLAPKKADMLIERLRLAWLPHYVDATGLVTAAYILPSAG